MRERLHRLWTQLLAWFSSPLYSHACPVCSGHEYLLGPDDGHSANVKCAECGAYYLLEEDGMTPIEPGYHW